MHKYNTKIHMILMVLFLVSCNNPNCQSGSIHGLMAQREKTVYICTGPMSQCYHSDQDCYGLQHCSKSIETVSLTEAIKDGRRPCKYCH